MKTMKIREFVISFAIFGAFCLRFGVHVEEV